jgi:peptidoglycan/LPS O-acetylase OafA/YrhL
VSGAAGATIAAPAPGSEPAPARAQRNLTLQALRAVAAGAVLLFHAAYYSGLRTGAPWLVGIPGNNLGSYGVLAFFVLSGFLMEAAVRRYDRLTFALHRVARLYPTFWLVCAAFFLIQSARFGGWEDVHWKALTLLPFGEVARPLAVEWTLVYELFFYGVCTLVCLRPRAHLFLLLAWLAVIALAFFGFRGFGTTGQPTVAQIPFSALNVGFICGGLAGHVNRSRLRLPAAAWLTAGLLIMLLPRLAPTRADLFASDLGMGCIVLGLARAQLRAPAALAPLRWLAALGDRSYGLYLAHCLAIQIALNYVPATLPPLLVYAAMVVFGLAVGSAVGSVDVALYRWLKRRIDRARSGRLPADIVAAAP